MQLRHPPVIAMEKRQKIFRQVLLVGGTQGTDDAEVHGDVAGIVRMLGVDEDIAGMHVGVKETIAEYLGKKNLHPTFRQLLQIHPAPPQFGDIAHGDTVDPLHHQHLAAGFRPEHLGYVQDRRVLEIAPQLTGVGGLADQIQLIENGLFVLGHHLDRPQPTPLSPIALRQAGDDVQQFHIAANGLFDAGPHHLDHHLPTAVQAGGMHLGN